jgi:hypothetical protein
MVAGKRCGPALNVAPGTAGGETTREKDLSACACEAELY